MHTKSLSSGIAMILLLLTAGLAATVNGRLPAHAHQHRGLLDRVLLKPVTGSDSGFLASATHDPIAILPLPTSSKVGSGCFDDAGRSINATHVSEHSIRVTPVPQIQSENPELRDELVASLPTRRRQRLQALLNGDEASGIHSYGSSITYSVVPTKSKVLSSQTSMVLPTAFATGVNGNPKKSPVEVSELDDFPVAGPQKVSKSLAPRQDDGYQSFIISFSAPTSTLASEIATALSTAPSMIPNEPFAYGCPSTNGSIYTSIDGIDYKLDCDTDYVSNNLQFQLVGSFGGCMQKCDAWNFDHHRVQCLAALFIPDREADADDCYLKSDLGDPSEATLSIWGAVRMGYATSTHTSAIRASSASMTVSTYESTTTETRSSTLTSAAPTASVTGISSPGITYGPGSSVIVPKVASSHLQGVSQNTPSQQYIEIKEPSGVKLPSNLLQVGANGDLTTNYGLSPQTGVLEVNVSTQSHLGTLTNTPHLSRDGGRGGMVNGEHLFIFCDTGSYSTTTEKTNGDFLGFVSSSVAIDVGMKGLSGGALNLQDGIGQWSDNAGRMRGFAPLTDGEWAYNQAMQGQGQRYAVWPESDIIPLDATSGIIYAPIVYDNVNQATKAAVFTYTGTTLLTVTAGGKGGPVAERTVEKMFQQNEVEWGCAGGIRSWGASGIGGDDGSVYLFGNVAGGVLLARTSPQKITDATSIEYWNGKSWTNQMLTSSSTAYFIAGAFMDINVFYSPRHLTFIAVYLTIYADSTFYYRYLEADQGILPPFAPGGDKSSDYVENILKYQWSEQQVLYKAAKGLSGKYIYSGGPHLGYYGLNDIMNGGSKMLLSWSAPTGLDPSTFTSEYQLITAEVDWA